MIDLAFDVGWAWRLSPREVMTLTPDEINLYCSQYNRLREREKRNGRA